MREIIYTKYSTDRDDRFKIKTDIAINDQGEKTVRKSPLSFAARDHVNNIYRIYEKLEAFYENTDIQINACRLVDGGVEFPFIVGETFEEYLDRTLETDGAEAVLSQIKNYCEVVKHGSHKGFDKTADFVKVFGDVDFEPDTDSLSVANVDLLFCNILVHNGWNIIDYEWTFFFDVPADYIVYRAVSGYVNGMFDASSRDELKNLNIYELLDINPKNIQKYRTMDVHFSRYVIGTALTGREMQSLIGKPVVDVKKQVKKYAEELQGRTIQIFLDYGNDFNERDCYYIMPSWNNESHIEQRISIPENCRAIRIDPMIGNGFLKVNALKVDGEDTEYCVNGIVYDNDVIAFYNDDPQILINNISGKSEIYLEGMVVFSEQFVSDGVEQEQEKYLRLEEELRKKDTHIQNLTAINSALECELNQNIWKRLLKSNPVTLRAGRFAKSLIHNGPKATFQIVSKKIKKRLSHTYEKESVVLGNAEVAIGDNVHALTDMPEAQTMEKSIAVHLHLFYFDLLPEFVWYLNNIPYPFDLFISCPTDGPVRKIRRMVRKIKNVNKIVVRECENRGRDIAPLYVGFREEIEKYDYFLHMHSKKSLYTGAEKIGWRQMSLDSLLGSEEIVRKIFGFMEQKQEIGLVYPEYYNDFCMFHCSWLTNDIIGPKFLESIGIERNNMMFHYPAGSFFWAKTDAVKPLFDIQLKLEDFPEEKGQTDTTLAHVLERAVACVAEDRGYVGALIDLDEKVVRVRRSLKLFRDYMNYQAPNVIEELRRYNIISFDIFGTLVTEKVCNKTTLYRYVQEKSQDIIPEGLDFVTNRKKAENEAEKKFGDRAKLTDIYACLAELTGIGQETADQIRMLEEQSLAELTIPRKDMQIIYNAMLSKGKRIVLVEDTYYSREILETILKKCGYGQYEELWISSEIGKRKDKDELWDAFFEKYSKKRIVHVGDNPRADWQTVYDRGEHAFWVMNGYDEFVMSNYYETYEHLRNGTFEDAMKLGELVHEKYFNSPFALKGPEGNEVRIIL